MTARFVFAFLGPVIALAMAFMPARAATAHSGAARHVIHVSVDGLNAAHLEEAMAAGKLPTFQRLRDEGASTLNARTDYTHTVTLPNHTCMLTGRPVRAPESLPEAAYHNYTDNKVPKVGKGLHDPSEARVGYVASVFDVVHDAGLSTALYASKDKFVLFDQSYDASSGAPSSQGRDKVDVFYYASDGPPRFAGTMHARFLSDMRTHRFNYAFVHYRDTDTTGHALGWGTSGWQYALANIDRWLGEVLALVESDAELAGRTSVIVTSDHGGKGFGHDERELAENYTIPVFVWGAGVRHGDLYAINGKSRTDPGRERVPYGKTDQPIRNGGTGNLALSLLGLGPIPRSTINGAQDLRVGPEDARALGGSADRAASGKPGAG